MYISYLPESCWRNRTPRWKTSSLFVRNLNFSTTTAELADAFKSLDGFTSAQVKTKKDPKKPGQVLSMGFGFVHFRSKAQATAALEAMDGHVLQAHTLAVKASHRGLDAGRGTQTRRAGQERRRAGHQDCRQEPAVRGVQEGRAGPVWQLRPIEGGVRIPQKLGGSRGFAFADFASARTRKTPSARSRTPISWAAGSFWISPRRTPSIQRRRLRRWQRR